MHTRPLMFAALLALPLAFSPAPASAGGPTIRVDVDTENGEDLHLTLGGGLLSSFIRAFAPVDIDCDNHDDDPKVRALYLTLESNGDGARSTVWDDRKRIDARRSGKNLEMRIHDEDGDTVDLTLPWSLARCVLGGENVSRQEITRAVDSGTFSVHVKDDGSEVHISVN